MEAPDPTIAALAEKLQQVYRKWAGNMHCGDHLPETWWAVAAAALEDEGLSTLRAAVHRRAVESERAEKAEAEVERLRAAMQLIATLDDTFYAAHDAANRALEIARQALEQKS